MLSTSSRLIEALVTYRLGPGGLATLPLADAVFSFANTGKYSNTISGCFVQQTQCESESDKPTLGPTRNQNLIPDPVLHTLTRILSLPTLAWRKLQ